MHFLPTPQRITTSPISLLLFKVPPRTSSSKPSPVKPNIDLRSLIELVSLLTTDNDQEPHQPFCLHPPPKPLLVIQESRRTQHRPEKLELMTLLSTDDRKPHQTFFLHPPQHLLANQESSSTQHRSERLDRIVVTFYHSTTSNLLNTSVHTYLDHY